MSGWTRVSERLPDTGVDVLARVAGMTVIASLEADDDGRAYWSSESDDVADESATHWMPLPSPPEDEGNGIHSDG